MSEVQVVKEEPTASLHHPLHQGDKHTLHSAMPIAAPLSLVHPGALPSISQTGTSNPFGPSFHKQSMNPFPSPFGSNMHSFPSQPSHPFPGYPTTQSLNGQAAFPPVPFPANPPDPGNTPYAMPNPMFYAPVHYNAMQYGHNPSLSNPSIPNHNGGGGGVDDNDKLCGSEEQQTDDDSKQSGDSKNSKPYSFGNGMQAYYLIPLNTPNGHSSAYMPLINGSSVTDNENEHEHGHFSNNNSNASPASPPRPSSSESELTQNLQHQLHHDGTIDSGSSYAPHNGIDGGDSVLDPLHQNEDDPLMPSQSSIPSHSSIPSIPSQSMYQYHSAQHHHLLSQQQQQQQQQLHHHHHPPYFNVTPQIPTSHLHPHLPFAVPTQNGVNGPAVDGHPFPPPVLSYSDLSHGQQPSFSLAPIDPNTQHTEPPMDEKHILEDKKDILLSQQEAHSNTTQTDATMSNLAHHPSLSEKEHVDADPNPSHPTLGVDPLNQLDAVLPTVPTHAPSFMLQPPTPMHPLNVPLPFPPLPTNNPLEHSAAVNHSAPSFNGPEIGESGMHPNAAPPVLSAAEAPSPDTDAKPMVPVEMPPIEEQEEQQPIEHTNNYQAVTTNIHTNTNNTNADININTNTNANTVESSPTKSRKGRLKPIKKNREKSPKKIPKKIRKQAKTKKVRSSIILSQRQSPTTIKKQDISVAVPALNKMGISPNKLQSTPMKMKGRKMTRNRRRSASNRVMGKTKVSDIPTLGDMRISRKHSNGTKSSTNTKSTTTSKRGNGGRGNGRGNGRGGGRGGSRGGGRGGGRRNNAIPPPIASNGQNREGEMEVAYSQQYPQVGFPYIHCPSNEEGKKFTCKFMDSSSSDSGPGFCDRQFGQKCHWMRHCLEKHVPTEMSQRYQCRYCTMKYAQNSSLKEHVAICHSNKPPSFKCPYCTGDITFTRWTSVLRHCRNQHPNQEEPKKHCRPRESPKGRTAALRRKRKTPKKKAPKKKVKQQANGQQNGTLNAVNTPPKLNGNHFVNRNQGMNTNTNSNGRCAMDIDRNPVSSLPLPQNILPHVNMNISMNQMLSGNAHPSHISNAAILPPEHRNMRSMRSIHSVRHG